MGPFKPVTESDIEAFNDLLADEIDSSFTSSIRCCEGCFDDFSTRWPGTTRNLEFQRGAMSADWAVRESRLPGVYDPAEISTLVRFVRCPRCGSFVRGWIWVHEHAAADALEAEIELIGEIAQRTPFLILDDPFARRVLVEVRRLGAEAVAEPLPTFLYRARRRASISLAREPSLSNFGPPPAEVVAEGRFNHAGRPMLYLADSVATAMAEVGTQSEECCIASLQITGVYKILDLIVEYPDEAEWELLGAISASALLAAPRTGEGWVKKEYIFTRFVADCAINAGFDVIRYGSTKKGDGSNYALLNLPPDLSSIATVSDVVLAVA